MGSYFYISTHNGSTDVVTNSVGPPLLDIRVPAALPASCWSSFARYAYEPFGRVVKELSDMDADGDGIAYAGTFQFTGQEYEEETGLYNCKARLYDPDTGRFLQPDPVHTAQPGQDNWDRYAYVWNNPVNFTDPTGEFPSCGFSTMPGHNYSGPNRCGTTQTEADRDLLENYLLALQLWGPEAALVFAFWQFQSDKPNPTTPVDVASARHDNDVPGTLFGGGSTEDLRKFLGADAEWIREAWSQFTNPQSWKDHYDREYDAIPDWVENKFGRTGRSIVAAIQTGHAWMADRIVLNIGTNLFLTHIAFNAQIIALREYGKYVQRTFHVRAGRYKNIWSPGKWKL